MLNFNKYINTDMGTSAIAKWLSNHGYTKKIRQNGTVNRLIVKRRKMEHTIQMLFSMYVSIGSLWMDIHVPLH